MDSVKEGGIYRKRSIGSAIWQRFNRDMWLISMRHIFHDTIGTMYFGVN